MKLSARTNLLALQRTLLSNSESMANSSQLEMLMFEVAKQKWAVKCSDVAKVAMAADIIPLASYQQLPSCVVGLVAVDNEMLTVIDAGLLLGRTRCHQSLKTRLIVFGEGVLRGFALVVERVSDRLSQDDMAAAGGQHLSSASLLERIEARANSQEQTT